MSDELEAILRIINNVWSYLKNIIGGFLCQKMSIAMVIIKGTEMVKIRNMEKDVKKILIRIFLKPKCGKTAMNLAILMGDTVMVMKSIASGSVNSTVKHWHEIQI